MKMVRAYLTCLISTFVSLGAALPAVAEFSCAPAEANISFPTKNSYFAGEVAAWSKTTRSRYTEGATKDACRDVKVPNYKGFPTKRCKYKNADAGADIYPALVAEVIVLNPSAEQLAAWSINACRANGATDAGMRACLNSLRTHIIKKNGAQFPVIGSVVESKCSSSEAYTTCELPQTDPGLKPRHTWFRDGVSVDFEDALDVHWDDRDYSDKYDVLLDFGKSEQYIKKTFKWGRLAAADRDDWRSWRRHIGKPEMPDGATGSVDGHGWRTVTAYVHKAACRGTSNELFNAVVYTKKWARP